MRCIDALKIVFIVLDRQELIIHGKIERKKFFFIVIYNFYT